MLVRDLMTRIVHTVHPSATLQEAARKMKLADTGALPVTDGELLVGMITDRDITVRMTADGVEPDALVEEAMTPNVLTCFVEDGVRETAALMERHQVRRVPVLDAQGDLVGIVSLADLVLGTDDASLSAEVIEGVSEQD